MKPAKSRRLARQCFENIEAWRKHHNAPPIRLAKPAGRVCCWFEYSQDFLDEVLRRFNRQPWAPKNHGPHARRGWRERTPLFSVQIVQHDIPTSEATPWVVDRLLQIDVDYFPPGRDLLSTFGHAGEWIAGRFGGKTDPRLVAWGLRNIRGIEAPNLFPAWRPGGLRRRIFSGLRKVTQE